MSKNLTRKGLAFGALVALGASVFAGSPAIAADNLSTEVALGTSYTTVTGAANAIVLKTLIAPSQSGNQATLKYRITNPTGATLDINLDADGNGSFTQVAGTAASGYFANYTSKANQAAGTTTAMTDFALIPGTAEDGLAANANSLKISSTSAATITVQAWLDTAAGASSNLDGVEDSAPVRTVTYIAPSSITWTSALNTPNLGDTTLKASVTTSPEINGNYLGTTPTVKFGRQGSSTKIESAVTTWSNTTKSFNTDTAVDLATNNWVGMPNILQVTNDESLAAATTNVVVTTSTTHGLGLGDVVSTFNLGDDADTTALSLVGTNNAVRTVDSTTKFTTDAEIGAVAARAEADTVDAYVVVASKKLSKASATKTAATYTTVGEHRLSVGDYVIIDASLNGIFDRATRVAVASVPSVKTFTVALATAQTAETVEANDTGSVTYDSFDEVVPGTYTATAWLGGVAVSAAASNGTSAAAAKSIRISTTGSATLQGVSKVGAAGTIDAKTGTVSVLVTATVLDVDGVAVGAGHTVSVEAATTLSTGVKLNGLADGTADGTVLLTDAKGQVTFTITSPAGVAADSAAVSLKAENVADATASFTIDWNDASIGFVDLATTANSLATSTRTIIAGSSYDLSVAVADQFNTAADSALYRVKVTGAGVVQGAVALTSGKATITVTDNKLSTTTFDTTLRLQKLVSGVWTDQNADVVITNNIAPSSIAVNLGASASSVYGNAVVTSSKVAAVAIADLDQRTSLVDAPAYANNGVLNGQVVNKSTGASLAGTVVKVSGPSNVLFKNGSVYKSGSITVLADANGKFEVNTYSTVAQTDSVITFTALGVASTVKVSFTGVSTDVKKLTITPNAATYIPGQTVLYTVKLTDNLGNPVNTTAPAATPAEAYITVTYAGPGIISQTLPVETDASGEAQVRIVTGVVDTQAAVLTVKYDQNYDGDFVDTYDLTATSTVYAAGHAPSSAVVAASGSTGKFYVSATGAANRTVVVKVAGKFVKSFVPTSATKKVVAIVASAGNKAVTVFVGGKLALTKTVTVK